MNSNPIQSAARPDGRRAMVAVGVGLAIFLLCLLLPPAMTAAGAGHVLEAHPWLSQVIIKSAMFFLTALAIVVLGGGRFAEYGFRRARGARWGRIIFTGMLMGAAASATLILSGARGNPVIQSYTFLQIVLIIWLLSSISEEVLTRGFVQSHMDTPDGNAASLWGGRISIPVFISALFFGAMHLSLAGRTDAITVVILVVFTFMLGLVAGHFREKYQSLVPAIAVHVAFNVGGVAGAIAAMIIKRLTHQ